MTRKPVFLWLRFHGIMAGLFALHLAGLWGISLLAATWLQNLLYVHLFLANGMLTSIVLSRYNPYGHAAPADVLFARAKHTALPVLGLMLATLLASPLDFAYSPARFTLTGPLGALVCYLGYAAAITLLMWGYFGLRVRGWRRWESPDGKPFYPPPAGVP
ncbi:hypothetical protein LJC04_03240 [Ruminococcaceae bacterium OttesenSCG-928-O06]|nr:hypothetical protein [Ruminococcaceae bacterium OttesenSCG-928-O06]